MVPCSVRQLSAWGWPWPRALAAGVVAVSGSLCSHPRTVRAGQTGPHLPSAPSLRLSSRGVRWFALINGVVQPVENLSWVSLCSSAFLASGARAELLLVTANLWSSPIERSPSRRGRLSWALAVSVLGERSGLGLLQNFRGLRRRRSPPRRAGTRVLAVAAVAVSGLTGSVLAKPTPPCAPKNSRPAWHRRRSSRSRRPARGSPRSALGLLRPARAWKSSFRSSLSPRPSHYGRGAPRSEPASARRRLPVTSSGNARRRARPP